MTMVFHEGDRVEFDEFHVYTSNHLQTYTGTIHRVLSAGIAEVMRDDGLKGSGDNGGYLVLTEQCRIVKRPEPWTEFPTGPEVKKGYTPDGFDPNAHREFMRNI